MRIVFVAFVFPASNYGVKKNEKKAKGLLDVWDFYLHVRVFCIIGWAQPPVYFHPVELYRFRVPGNNLGYLFNTLLRWS